MVVCCVFLVCCLYKLQKSQQDKLLFWHAFQQGNMYDVAMPTDVIVMILVVLWLLHRNVFFKLLFVFLFDSTVI